MKKSTFVAMILGTVGGILFALDELDYTVCPPY